MAHEALNRIAVESRDAKWDLQYGINNIIHFFKPSKLNLCISSELGYEPQD